MSLLLGLFLGFVGGLYIGAGKGSNLIAYAKALVAKMRKK